MRIATIVAAALTAVTLNAAGASNTTIAGNQKCAKPAEESGEANAAVQYLISGGWIMGWLSAANRMSKADWLANVRPEHITELIDKYCQGDATVEEAGLHVLAQLRMEYAARAEYRSQTGKDAPPE